MSEKRTPLVSPLRDLVSHEEWDRLTAHRWQTYRPGATLLRQGDMGSHVVALESGLVRVVRVDRGGRQRLLAFRGPGDILGEMALQCGVSRSASVLAMTQCRAAIVVAEDFRRLLRDYPLAERIAVMTAHRLREQVEVHDGAVHERLAMALLRLVEVAGGQHSFSLTREQLAQHINVGRKAVSKALECLGPDKVKAGKSWIEVTGVEGLRETVAAYVSV